MQSSQKTITAGILFFLATCLVSVAGYCLAGWDFIDALYMVTITVYGVGYGEVNEITDPRLKLFTMGVIIAGCTSAIYVFGGFVQFLVEGEFNRFVGKRKMKHEIALLRLHVILCGFGRVGQILARELHANQREFVVVDSDEQRLQVARELGYLAVQGNATDEETLLSAGIQHAESLAAVLSDDVQNVFITLTAKELRKEINVFARAENPTTEKKLRISGANQVVLPAAIGARRIAESILARRHDADSASGLASPLPSSIGSLDKLGFIIQRCLICDSLNKMTLEQVENKISVRFLSLELVRVTGEIIARPLPAEILHKDDTLVVLGPAEVQQKMINLSQEKKQYRYRGASG